jgi:hypothetical protein
MIPKCEMKGGRYYKGICRDTYVARWDDKHQEFVYIGFKWEYRLNTIPHFEDVKDTRLDGFIPVEEITNLEGSVSVDIKSKEGYFYR